MPEDMNFSPLDDKTTGAIVLVMQRLHEDDIAGKLLREGGWEHLNLPAIAEEDENVAIGPHTIHRRRKGDVLHQAREPTEILEDGGDCGDVAGDISQCNRHVRFTPNSGH